MFQTVGVAIENALFLMLTFYSMNKKYMIRYIRTKLRRFFLQDYTVNANMMDAHIKCKTQRIHKWHGLRKTRRLRHNFC